MVVDLLAAATVRQDVRPDPTVVELAPRRPVPPPPTPPVADTGATAGPASPDDGTVDTGAGASEPSAAAPTDRLAELLSEVDVLVRVFGEVTAVRVTGPGDEGETLVPTRQRALEAITYLALRESAVDREDLEISLFPTGANAAKTVYNTVSSARALLGDELFPPPEGGRYELMPTVVTDYGVFSELVSEADETEDALAAADLLHQALTLVRGEPFTGVGRSYAWVGPHRGMIVAQVVDAAEELAEVRLASGDWRSAEWAARQGLRAFPSDERMYRLLMRTARAAGNIPGVQRVFRELCDVLADPELGVEPEDTVHPETIELLEELTGARPRQGRLGA
jgi:DNA-binding SARP family transcriptional activator